MNILRMLARQLASNSFRLLLLVLAVTGTMWLVFGSAASVKQLLDRSGAFDQLPNILIGQINDQQQPSHDAVSGQPEITSAAKASFNAQFLRSSVDQVIDGTYH